MKTEIFSSRALYLVVYREDNGTLSWISDYKGMKIHDVDVVWGRFPWSGYQCIILIDWMEKRRGVFRNLLCVGRDGKTRWAAELHSSTDRSVAMHMEWYVLSARTWEGCRIIINPKTGKRLSIVWEKC